MYTSATSIISNILYISEIQYNLYEPKSIDYCNNQILIIEEKGRISNIEGNQYTFFEEGDKVIDMKCDNNYFYISYTKGDKLNVCSMDYLNEDINILLSIDSNEKGGKLYFNDQTLYISVGDSGNPEYAGKIFYFDKNENRVIRYAEGFNNPVGLYSYNDEMVVLDDNSERGGIKEINIISKYNENFGWDIMLGDKCYITPDCDTRDLKIPEYYYKNDNEIIDGMYHDSNSISTLKNRYSIIYENGDIHLYDFLLRNLDTSFSFNIPLNSINKVKDNLYILGKGALFQLKEYKEYEKESSSVYNNNSNIIDRIILYIFCFIVFVLCIITFVDKRKKKTTHLSQNLVTITE